MEKHLVAIVKYEKPIDSVRKAVDLSQGLEHLPAGAKVFIKPNIVFWTKSTNFPKYGVITTSRVVEDMVLLLKEHGIDDISIGDGTVLRDPKDVDLPVMKTHTMTVVSLGIKNLKGMLDIPSRKKCHNTHPQKDLHFWVSRLADKMPPTFTLIDGIYTAERGPNIDGTMHRSNLLVASADVLAADMVGAKVLGYEPAEIPHLVHAAQRHNRKINLSQVEVVGEPLESAAKHHGFDFEYNKAKTLPAPMEKMGIRGLSYYKYDLSLCTYCSGMTSTILAAIARAWKGEPWDEVEILKPETVYTALQKAGIEVDRTIFGNLDLIPGKFLKRYKDRSEFDESFFTIS